MSTLPAKQVGDLKKESGNQLVISYLTLRNFIGICGMAMPLVLALMTPRMVNEEVMEQSISHYYYTPNGDVFVVLMSILGIFLLTYKGYGWVERMITILSALCAIGVAFSPTACGNGHLSSLHKLQPVVPMWFGMERHLVFAATFFLCSAIIALVYFPKTNKDSLVTRSGLKTKKAKRNTIFKLCGWTMILALILLFVHFITHQETKFPVVFVLETIAVEAFGIAWITKGQTLLPDGEHYISKGIRLIKSAF